MDHDLDALDREALVAEVKRLRAGIRAHRDSTENELCWHHPQLWGLLPEPIAPEIRVPAWPQFLRGCVHYRQSLDRERPDAPRIEREAPIFHGINVVSIEVPDLAAARTFYADILGLGDPVHDLPDAGWIEFSTGGTSGNLSLTQAGPDFAPAMTTTVVLDVLHCEAAVAALRQRGVRCDDPVTFSGFVTFASFYDPFGNRLQMCSDAPAE